MTNAQIADDVVHLGAHGRESCFGAAAQAPPSRPAQPGAACGPEAGTTPTFDQATRLPLPVTSLVGRTAERAALATEIAEHRMVTATGPGGVGKTRLALSVAAEIAPAPSRRGLVRRSCRRDRSGDGGRGGRPHGRRAGAAQCIDRGRPRRLARRERRTARRSTTANTSSTGFASCVERILSGCPRVTVLATSRSRLLRPLRAGLSRSRDCRSPSDGGDAVDLFAARVAAATGERTRRPTAAASPPCAGRSTVWRWPSSSRRHATRRSVSTGSKSGLDDRLRFLTGGTRVGRPPSLAARRDRLELRPPRSRRTAPCCGTSPCWPRGSTSTRPAPSPGSSARPRRGGRRAGSPGRATACSPCSAASRPATAPSRRSGSTGSSASTPPASWTPSAPATSTGVVGGRCAGPCADPDDAWCVRFDRVVDDVRAALRWCAADERRRAEAASLAADLAALLFGREGRRRRNDATSRPPGSPRQRAIRRPTYGWPPGPRPAATSATRPSACSRRPSTSPAPTGDRGAAARDLAWMSIYIDRVAGNHGQKAGTRRGGGAAAAAREMSDGSAARRGRDRHGDGVRLRDNRDPDVVGPLAASGRAVASRSATAPCESAALDQLLLVHQDRSTTSPRPCGPSSAACELIDTSRWTPATASSSPTPC